jgi:predicted membrane-bound mannosyltransferase
MDWNIIEILTMKEVDSNNHALNSILMKFCYFFFGSSELSLRLPNLIAGSLFIIYSLRISKLFGSSFILGSLIVLLGNHHLIDFFSIARGYGLALAFQLISIFHIIKYHQNHKLQDFILFGLALVFSCLSNLSFVAYATGALFFSGLIQIFSIEKKFLELFRYLTLLTLLWAVCFIPIYKMQQINMLNFGGDIGFYNDTILSLVQRAIS